MPNSRKSIKKFLHFKFFTFQNVKFEMSGYNNIYLVYHQLFKNLFYYFKIHVVVVDTTTKLHRFISICLEFLQKTIKHSSNGLLSERNAISHEKIFHSNLIFFGSMNHN